MERNMGSKQNITDEKRRIRKNVLALRDAMTPAVRTEKSSRIVKKLFVTEAYRSAGVILTYVN